MSPICATACSARSTAQAVRRGDAAGRRDCRRGRICRPRVSWKSIGRRAAASPCRSGSATSHVAMLARARGVPMIVQLGVLPEVTAIALLDGERASLELDPSPTSSRRLSRRVAPRMPPRRDRARRRAGAPAIYWRGEAVRLLINIEGPASLSHPAARFADGVGLMRTEFLFQRPRRAAGRGSAAPSLCGGAALGGRAAGDHPHRRRRRRQADPRPQRRRRSQPVPRPARLAAQPAAAGHLRGAIARAWRAPRCTAISRSCFRW